MKTWQHKRENKDVCFIIHERVTLLPCMSEDEILKRVNAKKWKNGSIERGDKLGVSRGRPPLVRSLSRGAVFGCRTHSPCVISGCVSQGFIVLEVDVMKCINASKPCESLLRSAASARVCTVEVKELRECCISRE